MYRFRRIEELIPGIRCTTPAPMTLRNKWIMPSFLIVALCFTARRPAGTALRSSTALRLTTLRFPHLVPLGHHDRPVKPLWHEDLSAGHLKREQGGAHRCRYRQKMRLGGETRCSRDAIDEAGAEARRGRQGNPWRSGKRVAGREMCGGQDACPTVAPRRTIPLKLRSEIQWRRWRRDPEPGAGSNWSAVNSDLATNRHE